MQTNTITPTVRLRVDPSALRAVLSRPADSGAGIPAPDDLEQTAGHVVWLRCVARLSRVAAAKLAGVSQRAWMLAESTDASDRVPLPAEAWQRFLGTLRSGSHKRPTPSAQELGEATSTHARAAVAAALKAARVLLGYSRADLEADAFGEEAGSRVHRIEAGGQSYEADLRALDVAIDSIWRAQCTYDLDRLAGDPVSLHKLRETWGYTCRAAASACGQEGPNRHVLWSAYEAGAAVIPMARLEALATTIKARRAEVASSKPGSLLEAARGLAGAVVAS